MNRNAGMFIIFMVGAATGACMGVLYAPEKGESIRDRLTYHLGKYRDRLKEIVDELVDERKAPINTAKSEGQRVIDDAKEKAERLLGDVEDLIGQIKNKK